MSIPADPADNMNPDSVHNSSVFKTEEFSDVVTAKQWLELVVLLGFF